MIQPQTVESVRDLGLSYLRAGDANEFARLMLYCRRRVKALAKKWPRVVNPFHAGHGESCEELVYALKLPFREIELTQEIRDELGGRIERLHAKVFEIWHAIRAMIEPLRYIEDEKDGAKLNLGIDHVVGRVGCTMARAVGTVDQAEIRVREIQAWWSEWCALLADAEALTPLNSTPKWVKGGEGRMVHRRTAATVRSVARQTQNFRRWVEVTAAMVQDFNDWKSRESRG
jgi:hypothetical protein